MFVQLLIGWPEPETAVVVAVAVIVDDDLSGLLMLLMLLMLLVLLVLMLVASVMLLLSSFVMMFFHCRCKSVAVAVVVDDVLFLSHLRLVRCLLLFNDSRQFDRGDNIGHEQTEKKRLEQRG